MSGVYQHPGTLIRSGTAVLDFGNTPDDFTSVVVTGQDDIVASSHVRTWFQGDTMVFNSPEDHLLAALFTRLATGDLVPGEGFTIYCVSIIGRWTKRFRVNWVWS